MQNDNTPVIWTVIACAIILMAGMLWVSSTIPEMPEIPTIPSADAIANAALAKIVFPTAAEISAGIVVPAGPEMPDVFPEYMLNEDEYEERLMEKEAERLAMDELNSKTFRTDLMNYLQNEINLLNGTENEQEGLEIESYRDIEDVYSIDMEDAVVDVDDETGEVEIEFKVKYVLDEDEDLVGKARVTVTYDIYELVVDDDFEDAEADEDFTLVGDVYLYNNLI